MRRIALLLALGLALVGCSKNQIPSADAVSPSEDSSSADSNDGGGGPTGLHPRFVLYDADGNPVKPQIYPFKPAPDWLTNAFDNPPYSVKVKY